VSVEAVARGRNAVLARLADAVRPRLGAGRESPDPELTARCGGAAAAHGPLRRRGCCSRPAAAARLLLTDP
jgi:hypothetical protein